MRLETVTIRGFRSIAELDDFKVGQPSIVTGHNDAGKTALLDATRFLLDAYEMTDRDATYDAAGSAEGSSVARVESTIVEGAFALSEEEVESLDLPATLRLRRRASVGAPGVYEVYAWVPKDPQLRDLDSQLLPELKDRVKSLGLHSSGQNKPDLLKALREQAASAPGAYDWVTARPALLRALPSVQTFNPRGVSDAEDSIRAALLTSYRLHERDDSLQGTLRDLEAELEGKVEADAVALRAHIMERRPDLGEVSIVPSVSFSSGLKHTFVAVTTKAGEAVQLGEAGAGRARRVALAVWEFNSNLLSNSGDVVILYDEPDTHLDYARQRGFMGLVRKQMAIEGIRMVIATHSMNLIDGVDISNVVLLEHDASARTTAKYLTDDSSVGAHLGSIAASLGLRNTVLLHERLFVGVEGATEAAAFPVLFRLSTGRQLEACGIAMWPCDNNEGALKFAAFLARHGRAVVFLVDQDSKKNSKHLFNTNRLKQHGLDEGNAMYLGHPDELRDLFADALWVRVANAEWPRVDGVPWQTSQVAALRTGKFSSQLLELMKSDSESGPQNKQELMTTLALNLEGAHEVPSTLRDAFATLIERAA